MMVSLCCCCSCCSCLRDGLGGINAILDQLPHQVQQSRAKPLLWVLLGCLLTCAARGVVGHVNVTLQVGGAHCTSYWLRSALYRVPVVSFEQRGHSGCHLSHCRSCGVLWQPLHAKSPHTLLQQVLMVCRGVEGVITHHTCCLVVVRSVRVPHLDSACLPPSAAPPP